MDKTKKLLQVIEIVYILIAEVVSEVGTLVKTHQIVSFKWMVFSVFESPWSWSKDKRAKPIQRKL